MNRTQSDNKKRKLVSGVDNLLHFLRKKEKLRIYIQLCPTILWLTIFFLAPLCILVIYSFWDMVGDKLIAVWSFHNYLNIFIEGQGLYVNLLLKSLGMSGLITLLSIGLAYPVAYYLSFRIAKYKYAWLMLLAGPYLVCWVVLVFGWRLIIGYNGLINYLGQILGLFSKPIEWMMFNWWTVVFIQTIGWAPWLVWPIFVSLEKIDKTLLEAASDLGATPTQAFLKITLPLSTPGLLVATFFILIPTFGQFITPTLVGGPEGAMYGNAIEYCFVGSSAWPFGSALSVFLMIISLIIAMILIRLTGLKNLMESL